MVLRVPRLWVITLVIASVMVGLITTFYIASVVDPLAHLNNLPIVVVNEDAGDTIGGQHFNIGRQVETGLMASPVVVGGHALCTRAGDAQCAWVGQAL
jgi:uncharacterized phage infection (PIP) family protein YhgE